jgi:hypothetical protein
MNGEDWTWAWQLFVATVVIVSGGWAFVAALLMGPARELLGSPFSFLDAEKSLDETEAPTVRRPWSKHLKDPTQRQAAIERYRERAKLALEKGWNNVRAEAVHRMAFVLSGTIGGSTIAFATFIAWNDLLFRQGEALAGANDALLQMIWQHIIAAYGLTPLRLTAPLQGLGAETASQLYYYILLWSIPVVVRQVRWVSWGMRQEWLKLTESLQAVVALSDEALGARLDAHYEKRTAWSPLVQVWAQALAFLQPRIEPLPVRA